MYKNISLCSYISAFIPLFSYKSHPTTPSIEIANIPVYFLNTSCDCASYL